MMILLKETRDINLAQTIGIKTRIRFKMAKYKNETI
jgi:hypothetical protein